MPNIKTILIALDLEDDDSQHVANRAIQLASQHKAQIIGVHVIENLPLQDANLPPSIDTVALSGIIQEQKRHQLQSRLAGAEESAVLHLTTGKPHDAIEALALSHRVDLIIIGPGVRKNLKEKVFGSTADRVVRSASCPVLIVRSDANAPYRHIAIGVDFSEYAQAAAQWASRLSPTASRDLIHAFEIPLAFEQAMLKANTSRAEIDSYRRAKARAAHRQLIKLFGEDGVLPKATRARVVHGNPSTALINASRRGTVDLIALGTRGTSTLARHLLGSVSRQTLAGAKCDVLAVPTTL